MTNKFDWARMYKDEEYLEREAYSCVEAALQRHYDILQSTRERHVWRASHGNQNFIQSK